MANADRPNGARPYGAIYRVNLYRADAAVSQGDLVKRKAGDGTASTQKLADVEPATAGDASMGVAAHAADAGAEVLVYDDPQQRYEMQVDDASIADAADVGLNADITGASGAHEVDGDTKNTTATLQVKILQVVRRVDNDLGTNAKVVVKINNHQLAASTGTAGV